MPNTFNIYWPYDGVSVPDLIHSIWENLNQDVLRKHILPCRYKEAIKECSNALDEDPVYVRALTRRAKAYEAMGHYKQALTDIQKANKADLANPDTQVQQYVGIVSIKKWSYDIGILLCDNRKIIWQHHHIDHALFRGCLKTDFEWFITRGP